MQVPISSPTTSSGTERPQPAAAPGARTKLAALLAAEGGDAPALAVKEMYADGVHTVAWLQRSDDGRQLDQAVVFHIDDSGKATEVWSMPTDAEIADALANGGNVAGSPQPARVPRPPRRRAARTPSSPTTSRTSRPSSARTSTGARAVTGARAEQPRAVHRRSSRASSPEPATRCTWRSSRPSPTTHMCALVRRAHLATHPTAPSGAWTSRRSTSSTSTRTARASSSGVSQDDPDETNAFWAP